jgi:hypothetical protein
MKLHPTPKQIAERDRIMEENRRIAEAANKRIAAAEAALRALGVEIKVDACGCCESPLVSLRISGQYLLNGEEECKLDTFEEQA